MTTWWYDICHSKLQNQREFTVPVSNGISHRHIRFYYEVTTSQYYDGSTGYRPSFIVGQWQIDTSADLWKWRPINGSSFFSLYGGIMAVRSVWSFVGLVFSVVKILDNWMSFLLVFIARIWVFWHIFLDLMILFVVY